MSNKKMKFEDKIKELEKIVQELENGEVNLDDSIAMYTEAMNLISECDKELKSAEENINKILTSDGKLEKFEIKEEK